MGKTVRPSLSKPEPWRTKLMDDWLPIPAALLERLGWVEGTEVEIFTIAGTQQIVIRKVGYVEEVGKTGGVDVK